MFVPETFSKICFILDEISYRSENMASGLLGYIHICYFHVRLGIQCLLSLRINIPYKLFHYLTRLWNPHIQFTLGLKKSCLFPVTYLTLTRFFFQKIPIPNFFSALPTHNQRKKMHKTHIFDQKNYQFLKKIPTYPIFFRTITGNEQLFF